jgi:hypothetical protein
MNPVFAGILIFLSCLGVSASVPRVELIRAPDAGIQPQAVTDDHGVVRLIYLKGDPAACDIFYVHTLPGQTDFSKPLKVNSHPGSAIALGTIRGAQIAIGKNGRVHVAWNGHVPEKGSYKEAPMWYTRLNDPGTVFEPERNVITSAGGLDGGGSVAADKAGNVFVMWHAPQPGNTNGESGRAVFVARSNNDGKTFAPERLASSNPTGACGCCGMRAFADSHGNLFALYRGATDMTNRDEILLMSRDHGAHFEEAYEHHWSISSCPMSSAFLADAAGGVLAAAETHDRVYYVRMNPATGQVSEPVSPEVKGKHPVAIANGNGVVLLVWVEGTGWAKGGQVAWQLYSPDGKAISEIGRVEGLPMWSMAAAFAQAQGDFVIVY